MIPIWINFLMSNSTSLASFYEDLQIMIAKDSAEVVLLLNEGKQEEAVALASEGFTTNDGAGGLPLGAEPRDVAAARRAWLEGGAGGAGGSGGPGLLGNAASGFRGHGVFLGF